MQGTLPTQEDIRAEQDRIAVLVDQAAVEAGGLQTGHHTPAPDPVSPSVGPALTTAMLEAGIVRLAAELRGPEQTLPKFVGQTLGVDLESGRTNNRSKVKGVLNSGTYLIELDTLYPSTPAQQVSIFIEPANAQPCALDFKRLAHQLKTAGYEGEKMPRSMDPSVSFSKTVGELTAFVRLDVDSHDAPQCVWQVLFDLEATDV